MEEETKVSRRSFLKKSAAGAVAAGALAAAPSLLLVAERTAGGVVDGVTTPLVAYVKDAAKGEVVIMVGTREVTRKDPGLVARLAAMAG
ncbi:MAG TPA: twin-arginine translocation signal domain-containing protein [Thermoplasmata archaeon]|nr:twin-arginine translocation signal domain-containing protein [Thermoplasmata archaeon]